MIQINFPPDPSKLLFILDDDIPSVYLLARAVHQYGADNLNVIDRALINQPDAVINYSKVRASAAIADHLGLSTVGYSTLESTAKLSSSDPVIKAHAVSRLRDGVLKAFNQQDSSLDEVAHSTSWVITVTSIMQAMGIMNSDGDLDITQAKYKLASYRTLQDDGSSNQLRDITMSVPDLVWAPLVNYSRIDILKSAQKEGLMDVISMIYHCTAGYSEPCGVCDRCNKWKMRLIQAEVV